MRRPAAPPVAQALLLVLAGCATTAKVPPAPPPPASYSVFRTSHAWTRIEPPPPLPRLPRSEPKVSTTVLPNGLTVVVVENHRRPLVSARLLFPSGTTADSDASVGATFLSVSMLDLGFESPLSEMVAQSVYDLSASNQAADLGAHFSYDVGEDSAWIGVDGVTADLREYLQILFGAVVRVSEHEPIELLNAAERGDGIAAMGASHDALLERSLERLAFGEGHPYGRPYFGTTEDLIRLGSKKVEDRQAALFNSRGSTLLVVGDVAPGAVVAQARSEFQAWDSKRGPAAPKLSPPPVKPRKTVTFLPRTPAKLSRICVTRALSDTSATTATLEVLASVLTSGRLSPALREEKGMTYGVSGRIVQRRWGRALLACTRVSPAATSDALALFLKTMCDTAGNPPTDDEVAIAKAGLVTSYESTLDDVQQTTSLWTSNLSAKAPTSVAAHVAELQAVTADEVRRVAKAVLEADTLQVVLAGERAIMEQAARANQLGPLRKSVFGGVPE